MSTLTMRVTVGSQAYANLSAIRGTSSTLASLQAHLSSGKQILQPSDDPIGTVRAMGLRGELARNDQYHANADDALAWLSTADTAYSSSVQILQNARTLVVQGLNSGANDAATDNALADQIDAARTALLQQANATYNGRPVFGGTTAAGKAYDAAGAYVGDTGSVTRAIGANTTVAVSQQGPTVFGPTDNTVFDLLSSISTALRSSPSTLTSGSLTALDTAISRVSSAQAAEGATYAQVQNAQTTQTATGTALTTQLSSIEDVDMAEMAIKVTSANTAYQAALQTTARIGQVSLLDFLR